MQQWLLFFPSHLCMNLLCSDEQDNLVKHIRFKLYLCYQSPPGIVVLVQDTSWALWIKMISSFSASWKGRDTARPFFATEWWGIPFSHDHSGANSSDGMRHLSQNACVSFSQACPNSLLSLTVSISNLKVHLLEKGRAQWSMFMPRAIFWGERGEY